MNTRVTTDQMKIKHGLAGLRCRILTNLDINPIVHTPSILVFEQLD